MAELFEFELVAEDPTTHARAGVFHTAHGDIETPTFMPVGTKGSVKGLLPDQLREIPQAPVKVSHHFRICTFLRRKHVSSAVLSVKRIVNVTHRFEAHAPNRLIQLLEIHVFDSFDHAAGRDEAVPVFVKESCSEGCSDPKSRVIRAASAQG